MQQRLSLVVRIGHDAETINVKRLEKSYITEKNESCHDANFVTDVTTGCPYSDSSLRWRHNDHDCGSYYQPHGCLLNRLFRRKSKKTSKHRVTGLCVGNSPGPVNSPHKEPVTRKMFPFDDVIMWCHRLRQIWHHGDFRFSVYRQPLTIIPYLVVIVTCVVQVRSMVPW